MQPLTRKRVLQLCQESADSMQEVQQIRKEQTIEKGKKMELCWRAGTKLDWVWLDDDIEGVTRNNVVLYGAALQSVSVCFRPLQF